MVTRAWVLALTLLPAIGAGGAEPLPGAERAVRAAPESPVPPASAAGSTRAPLVERFRLFSLELPPAPPLDLTGLPDEKRLFHQQGDPDSLFTLGSATPEGQIHLNAAIEVNEIFLKAIPPDARVGAPDTRPRAAGSFLPLDGSGRPYQLRLGARLVW
jgi:hypothetical protein